MSLKIVNFSVLLLNSIAVALSIFLGIQEEDILEHMGERGILTSVSIAQLLIISLLSLRIFFMLYKNWKNQLSQSQVLSNRFFWQNSFTIWLISSLGFLLLTIDERYKIHERIDFKIHDFLQIEETGITDRIDDLIVFIYALIGIAILYVYREEIIKYRRAFSCIKYALVMVFVMILIDVISNRSDIIELFTNNPVLLSRIINWLTVIEESLKVFAEGYFIIACYAVLFKTKKSISNS